MTYRWLKRSRVAVSLVVFLLTALIFIDLYEIIPNSWSQSWLLLQFIPSLLTTIKLLTISSAGFFAFLLIAFLAGRVYCSTICPLGILQDIIARIGRIKTKKKSRYRFKKESPVIRYTFLGITAISLLVGLSVVITILDPYSIAGRFFTYLFKPLLVLANDGIALIVNQLEWYAIYTIKVYWAPILILILNLVFFIIIAYMAAKRGRLFCNTVCPVGSFLGLATKVSLVKIRINTDKCTLCANCAGVCKSECIDLKHQKIDDSRCVSCYNCLTVCNDDAIGFKIKRAESTTHKTDHSRREAIAGLFFVAGAITLSAQEKKEKRSKTGKPLKPVNKTAMVTPPGSKEAERFNKICTACGLCISSCPTKVMSASLTQYGLNGFMQPFMDYSTGECTFDCTICSNVCPTGALIPLSIEEKHTLQLGKAKFVKENCIVYTDEKACGACSEHCPTKAVNMVPYKGKLLIPQVDETICVGCGSCEHPCPLEPDYKAIYVDGNPVHLTAEKPKEEKKTEIETEDFPF